MTSDLDRVELLRRVVIPDDTPADKRTWLIDGRPLSEQQLKLAAEVTVADVLAFAMLDRSDVDRFWERSGKGERQRQIDHVLPPYIPEDEASE